MGICLVALLSSQAAAAPDLRFVVASDARGKGKTGVNLAVFAPMMEQIRKEAPSLVIFPGDMVNGAVKLKAHRFQLAAFRKALKTRLGKIPFFAVIGNHEAGSRGHYKLFREFFPAAKNGPKGYKGLAYYLRRGQVLLLIIATDQQGEMGLISDKQLAWIDQTLRANKDAQHIYVFGHQPAFPAGRHLGMSLDQYPEQRDKFWALLRQHRVDAYFCGHEHLYNGSYHQGIYQFILGSTGASIYKGIGGEFHNFGVVEVEGDQTTVTVKDEAGKVRRRYTFKRPTKAKTLTIHDMDRMSEEQIVAAIKGEDKILAWKAAWSAWRRKLRGALPAIIKRGAAVIDFKSDAEAYMLVHFLRALKFMPSEQGLPLLRKAIKIDNTTLHQEAVAAMSAYRKMKSKKK